MQSYYTDRLFSDNTLDLLINYLAYYYKMVLLGLHFQH